MPKMRSEFSFDIEAESARTALECKDVSLAVQNQKDEADINVIVRNFGLTGKVPQNVRMPTYGDFEFVGDYKDALHAIKEADRAFYEMPAEVRNRFDNDPALFVDFCSDPANLDEARKLGLAPPVQNVTPGVPTPDA